jgi:hypothetical protein
MNVCVRVRVRVREGEIEKKKKTSEPSLFILLPRHCEKRKKEKQVSWPAFIKKNVGPNGLALSKSMS